MNKKIISGVVMSCLILGMMTPVLATTKEENIYVNLDNEGKIGGVYVVNSFFLDEEAQIIDYGKYTEFRNLSSSEKIKSEGEKVTINGKKGKNYYQGTLDTKEIPWNITIKYYINEQEMNPKELARKIWKT